MSPQPNSIPATLVSEHAISAPEADYLFIQASRIPMAGNGLFTAITIYKEEIIAKFVGEVIDLKEAQKRKAEGKDDYFMNLHDGNTLDCMHTDCFAKYANDVAGTRLKINAFIGMDEHNQVCLIANKTITAGSEIYCSYGKKYWKQRKHYLDVHK